ncbi:MAG: two-component system response regulator [Gracilibacter sp. BRH_c7a]|nr:MAG: two-component system response regulator [Gracilibacter sp. BRH_c7a]
MESILIVDDEVAIRELLKYNLEKEGYKTTSAADGEQALNFMNKNKYDLVILDLMLPGINGLEVCRKMRQDPSLARIPIIMLTAKGEEIDKVVGLELGADDYVTKPFGVRELIARIKVRLRRTSLDQDENIIVKGDLVIDLNSFSIRVRDEEVDFTPKEFELLRLLATHPGKVYNRDDLLEKIWGYEYPGDTRTVDVHVRHLRQKIEKDPSNPEYIETLRGIGYRFQGKSL